MLVHLNKLSDDEKIIKKILEYMYDEFKKEPRKAICLGKISRTKQTWTTKKETLAQNCCKFFTGILSTIEFTEPKNHNIIKY